MKTKLTAMLLAACAMLGVCAEDNMSFATATELPVGTGTSVLGRLSATGRCNVFKLTNFKGAGAVKVTISGSSSTAVNAQFMIVKKPGTYKKENVGDPFTKVINEGYTVWARFGDVGTCYLQITYADNTSDEPAEYTLKASTDWLIPADKCASVLVREGSSTTMTVVSGVTYRIAGINMDPVPYGLASLGNDLFEATINGDVFLIADADGVLEYQRWIPSPQIAFGGDEPAGVVVASESGTVKLIVNGGSRTGPSSLKVFLSYQSAAAADLDLANATVNGGKVKGGLKFPLTLSWDTYDLSPVTIEIPVRKDKVIEDSEQLTFQIADVVGAETGEPLECTVTIVDPGYAELEAKIKAGTATPAEIKAWAKLQAAKAPYMTALAYPADGGKATGSGYCPEGKKVTLKATANKGWRLLGWCQGNEKLKIENGELSEDDFVATTPSLVIDRTAKPGTDTKTSTTLANITEPATFYAVFEGDPRVTATPVAFEELDDVYAFDDGKVTGAGRYAPGKKVTLKATANKGYAFGGWYEIGNRDEGIGNSDEDGLLSRQASFSFEMGGKDVGLYARFVPVEVDKASISLSVNGVVVGRDAPIAPFETNVMAGVALRWSVAADALSQTTVKVSGLPAGLKFTAKDIVDSKTKQVTVPANTIYGAPTAASKAGKDGKPTPSAVKITVTTAGKSSVTYLVMLTVDPLPAWAVGNFDGPVDGDAGTVSLTIATSGKISGKILESGRTWALSAGEFSRVENVEDVENGAVFYATVIGKAGKEIVTNEVTVSATEVELPGGSGLCGVASGNSHPYSLSPTPYPLPWTASQNLWKRADTKASQPVFKKSIVAEYHFCAADDKNNTVKITFKKAGAVSFSGKIGGVSVSGSAQVVRVGEDWQVTLYAPMKKGFAGWCETFPVELMTGEQNIVTKVELGGAEHDKVQLWAGGPYWATTNVGAKKPSECGYYFWWGDTVGYRWKNGQWVASDGSFSGFPFIDSNAQIQTYGNNLAALLDAGWITMASILAPQHDVAQVRWGEGWRMPTKREQQTLCDECEWTQATMNGVVGYEVRGRGEYASNSIFLPADGYGRGTSLYDAGSIGYYWSSAPTWDASCAWCLFFLPGGHNTEDGGYRYYGLLVRPVQDAE